MGLTVDTLDNGAAVVNIGRDGAYVMVEAIGGDVQVTVFNTYGEVLSENHYNVTLPV